MSKSLNAGSAKENNNQIKPLTLKLRTSPHGYSCQKNKHRHPKVSSGRYLDRAFHSSDCDDIRILLLNMRDFHFKGFPTYSVSLKLERL